MKNNLSFILSFPLQVLSAFNEYAAILPYLPSNSSPVLTTQSVEKTKLTAYDKGEHPLNGFYRVSKEKGKLDSMKNLKLCLR